MILLTGFEPFLGERINPSEKLLAFYDGRSDVETCLLPVSYQRGSTVLERRLKQRLPSAIVMLGQAGGRKEICLERVALNFVDSEHPDQDSKIIHERRIDPLGPPAFVSSFPLREWQKNLGDGGLPVAVSNSAGTYVCNYLYFQIQHWLTENQHKQIPVLFIHVPYLPEQLLGKDASTPAISLEVMRQTIDRILILISGFVSKQE